MRRFLIALVLGCIIGPGAALAQCAGVYGGGVPFNCTHGTAPQPADLVLGGQGTNTVRWSWSQVLGAGTMPGTFTALTATGPATFSGGLTGTLTGALTGHASLDLPLAGGTVTGATTFSGASTGLAITNNATIGGNLTVGGISVTTDDVSGDFVTATGSTTARTLAARAADVVNVRDFGAVGDGVADDSGALKAAINYVNAAYAVGKPNSLYVPAGIYLIKNTNGTMPSFATSVPGAVIGDGQHKSYVQMDVSYAGPLFSWADAWEGTTGAPYNPGPFVPSLDKSGPLVRDLTISGNLSASSEQDGLVFYDSEDHVLVQNVDFFFIPGMGISIGQLKNDAYSFFRESSFNHIKMWFVGNASHAAFDIASLASGGDVDNIVGNDIQIYAFSSAGLTLRAPAAGSSVAIINIANLRVEGNENDSATGNNINIGLSTDLGLVAEVSMEDTRSIGANSGHGSVVIDADASVQPYAITLSDTQIMTGHGGSGLVVNNARNVHYTGEIGSTAANVTFGAHAGSDLFINGYGITADWTYDYGSFTGYGAALTAVSTPMRVVGLPGSSNKVGTAALQGTTSTSAAVELTMDGAAPNTQNCFTPSYGQGFNLSIQLHAQDITAYAYYDWSVPIAHFGAPYGVSSANVSLGTPVTLSYGAVTGIGVTVPGDGTNGCPGITFTPPSGNTDTWNVTALVTFARAP
jgi:hypothetical protein